MWADENIGWVARIGLVDCFSTAALSAFAQAQSRPQQGHAAKSEQEIDPDDVISVSTTEVCCR